MQEEGECVFEKIHLLATDLTKYVPTDIDDDQLVLIRFR